MKADTLKQYLDKLGITKEPYYSYDVLADTLTNIERRLDKKSFAMFVAQSAFETAGYTAFIENLYYTSASRIASVWPSRFYVDNPVSGKRNAKNYVRNPQALANAVYADRNGNGPESTGDGYRYRGRGAFHLTFKNNYLACSEALYGDNRLVEQPELVEECWYAFESALWFWNSAGLHTLARKDDFAGITKKINGSTRTVKAREIYWTTAKAIIL